MPHIRSLVREGFLLLFKDAERVPSIGGRAVKNLIVEPRRDEFPYLCVQPGNDDPITYSSGEQRGQRRLTQWVGLELGLFADSAADDADDQVDGIAVDVEKIVVPGALPFIKDVRIHGRKLIIVGQMRQIGGLHLSYGIECWTREGRPDLDWNATT